MMLFKSGKNEQPEDDDRSELEAPERRGGPGMGPRGFESRHDRPGAASASSHRQRHARSQEVAEDEEGAEESEKSTDLKTTMIGLGRDIGIAFIILVIFIGSIWAYTQNWPPVVVVQSGSMMHDSDSSVGVIDTGDLVLVKKVDGRSDITTYYEGRSDDYKTYEEYGDVIIYKKNGLDPDQATPVIHRALLWLEFNAEATAADPDPAAGHFDIPELDLFDRTGEVVIDPNFPAYAPNENDGPLIINLNRIYGLMRSDPHSGFVTKGDNNPINNIDQYSTSTLVKPEWVIGKAKGEMPWFGLIKLYVSNSLEGSPPPTSVNMLILTLAVIIIVPIALEMTYTMYVNYKKARDKDEEEVEEAESERTRKRPRGQPPPPPPPPGRLGKPPNRL